ncbi:MAG: hypothetical protein QOE68_3174, partial [Thermoanaerobaculia bacterium]|nr:hypothetical protein [Thermoanaerobaculia bacterium]
GIGLTSVFWILAAMYREAWKKRDELQLNAVEVIDTLESVYDNFFMGVFGIISIALAHSRFVGLAGLIYFLIAIPKTAVPWIMGTKRRKAEEGMLVA